jgi:hypothetical protein
MPPESGPDSGAQTLAATRAAGGEDLAAAGGGEAGPEAMAALAHEFRGLISPLHGFFSADRASCLLNEMKSGDAGRPERTVPGPNEPAPGKRGLSSDYWSRLISECPVFVNVAGVAARNSEKPANGTNIGGFQGFWKS